MRFWEYNKRKIWLIGLISFGIPFLILLTFGRALDNLSWSLILAPLIQSTLMMMAFSVKGYSYFTTTNKIIAEDSNKSIIPLFDDGYTIDLINIESTLFFTTERLKGRISDFPVAVSYTPRSSRGPAELVFAFYPLSHSGTEIKSSRSISFTLNFLKELSTDIKPEVLEFVEQLKSEGYRPG